MDIKDGHIVLSTRCLCVMLNIFVFMHVYHLEYLQLLYCTPLINE